MIEVGENIRKEKLLKNMTQKQLATKAGISNSFLSDLEVGRTDPSLKTLYKISKALSIDIKDLL